VARRLLLTYLTITALTLAVVVVPLGRIFADREQSRLTFDIERDAQAVASRVEDALEAHIPPAIDATLAGYRATGGRIVIVDAVGVSVVDTDDLTGARRDFSTRPEIAAALDGQRVTGTRSSETKGTDLLYVTVPVTSGGVVHGAVRITYPTATVDARVRSTWLRLGALAAVVLGLVAVVGMAFAAGVTRPVRRLQRAATRLAHGDLAARVDAADGPPEIRALAATFNDTAAQLAQVLDAQHRFVADASHQLRTPLTALRLRLETLESHVDEDARTKLDAAMAETDRLGRLVHSLLVLARAEGGHVETTPIDVAAAVDERIDAWGSAAAGRSVQLRSVVGEAWALAVPGAVPQILDNLLSNALDAAPAGSEIVVRVEDAGENLELHVIDRGPGMDADARARAFGRFWQPPGDPNARTGFGLGLAIVAELAAASGGGARLEPGADGVGLDAIVTLPHVESPGNAGAGQRDDANLYPPLISS
jgi:signal transduction histidine kinase